MPTHRDALRAAFESRDLEQLLGLIDEQIVWRGLPSEHEDEDGMSDHESDMHDHEHPPMCTSREEVRAVLEQFLAGGSTGHPIVLDEVGDTVVVYPRTDPPLEFPLHQAFTFRGGRVVLIQDYPDRASALAALDG